MNLHPICAARPNASDERSDLSCVGVGRQIPRQWGEPDDLEALITLESDCDADERRDDEDDEDGARRHREQATPKGHVGHQAHHLVAVPGQRVGDGREGLEAEDDEPAEPGELVEHPSPQRRRARFLFSGGGADLLAEPRGDRHGILGGTSTRKTSVRMMSTKNSEMPVMTTDCVTASPTPAGPRLAVMPL